MMLNLDYYIIFLILTNFIIFSFVFVNLNPIFSILFLMLGFVNTAIFLLIIGVEFLALVFLVIYVGAISILFLFVIMMLDIKLLLLSKRNKINFSGLYFSIIGFVVLFFFIYNLNYVNLNLNYDLIYTDWVKIFQNNSDVKTIGFTLFNYHLLEFLIIGIILLIAMIACISLVLEENLITRKQNLYNQILIKNNLLVKQINTFDFLLRKQKKRKKKYRTRWW